jgi:hypothetical protein
MGTFRSSVRGGNIGRSEKIRQNFNVVAFGGIALKKAGGDLVSDKTKFSVVRFFEI